MSGELTDGVRRSLESAIGDAERNIDYLNKAIEKAEQEIRGRQRTIEDAKCGLAESEATRSQAQAMLDGHTIPHERDASGGAR